MTANPEITATCRVYVPGDQIPTNEMQRLYNPRYPMVSAHHYTADTNEVRVLTTQRGWKYEGIAWYGAN